MKKVLIRGVLLCLALSINTFAQTTNATLGGTVSDASGALIPGVAITATNTQTGIVTSLVSNESGTYQFASLQPGIYRVTGELPGFQTLAYNEVTLGLSQQVRLNFALQVGSVSQAVEVTVAADTLIATSSSSVGAVLPEYKVRDLPLTNRNVLDLVSTTAGTQGSSFAGAREGMVNTTRDGLSVQDARYNNGVYSVTYVSPDLVEEVRIIVAPADAETGRGSGQVQMATRSGTNQYRGAAFWANRNSALDASNWFNNFNGVGKNYLNRNQFGGRLGGPIVRNKTFFFFLYEGMRTVSKESIAASVLTEQARQGVFRYFPGVQSSIATSSNPTVDRNGNPVTPQGATGPLSSFSVFGRDPFRPGFDPTGFIPRALAKLPLPNDFVTPVGSGGFSNVAVADGLNIAGYRWVVRTIGTDNNSGQGENLNRNQYNLRLDHNFNSSHKLSLVGSRESDWADANITPLPNGKAPGSSYRGGVYRSPLVYTGSFVSTLSPTLLNEFRIGLKASRLELPATWDDPREGAEVKAALPKMNGIPYYIDASLFLVNPKDNPSMGGVSPLLMYGDNLSWTRAKHAFKGGVEFRFGGSDSYNSAHSLPHVDLGPSPIVRRYGVAGAGVPVTGIDNISIPGLAAADQGNARTLLSDLAGSVSEVVERFTLCCDPKDVRYKNYAEANRKLRNYRQNEISAFFKDDWKFRPNLTFNVGVRYEYYGVPYEDRGLMVSPIGGGSALEKGNFVTLEFVGKKSPQPGKSLFRNDWNNFAPAIGLSWSLPWFGQDKTVLRAGYGWSYQGLAAGAGIQQSLDLTVGESPGSNQYVVDQSITYRDLRHVVVPVPGVYPPGQLPVVSLNGRNEPIFTFDENMRTPYVQNWSLELQRELLPSLTVEARYIGSKGSKLYGGIPVNNVNIFENGILDAFNITRAGGNAPLFDQMLRGLNLGSGVVNGTTVTGSASLRQNTQTRGFIANGGVGQLASYLNTTGTGCNVPGCLLRNAGLPENYIVRSPQFGSAIYNTAPGSSTYHSMQLQATKRLAQGFTNTTAYTWSRAIGESDSNGTANYRNPRNRAFDKALLGFHRTHSFQSNGTYELPFGPNRPFLGDAPGWVSRLVERWQLGAIFSMTSGAPLTITAPTSSFTELTNGTPTLVGAFPKSMGQVAKVASGVVYFDGLGQIVDPARANVTALQTTQGSFSNRAITDEKGQVLLVNPQPGTLGNLGLRWIEGPGSIGLNMNLVKRVRIDETKEFEIRVDAINALNRPNFGAPNLNINSTSFGRITSSTGSRTFTLNARVNF